MDTKKAKISHLLSTIRQLRGTDGCPWDKKQTASSLIRYLEEEVAELIAAIKKNDTANICEETGDVLYILMMITEIHQEQENHDFSDVIVKITEKLIRRHPHVFDGKTINSDEELREQWESIKLQEKKSNN